MIGKIIKIHSDFYYVKSEANKILECKIREKLKKEKTEIFVGDLVEVEEDSSAITKILPRNNYLPRPSVANIDQIAIVTSLSQPELDFVQLNRYLSQAKLYDIPALICVNKSDLAEAADLKEKILNIYTPLCYKVVFTSALTGDGLEDLINAFKLKLTVLSGMSGVGKTSLLNKIHPDLQLKTKETSHKTGKGTHTTRHTEILEVLGMQIADTPGFSYLRFDTVLPNIINEIFDEIKEYSVNCQFSDCLHLSEENSEDNCNVLANLDKIGSHRYESYKVFVQEAVEYKDKLNKEGHKQEEFSKSVDAGNKETRQLVKLGVQARKKARNTEKQKFKKLNNISILEEVYYNQEESD